MKSSLLSLILGFPTLLALSGCGLETNEPDPFNSEMKTLEFTDNGAWCWFQDPRAVTVHGDHHKTYAQWMTREGRLEVASYDHASGEIETHVLEEDWDIDDHNVGAFLVLPDYRLMVFYARHNKIGLYCRTTSQPEDITVWSDPVTVSGTDRITYAHPVFLSEEGRYYVFWRGPTWKPTFATSVDGIHWSEPRVLVQEPGREAEDIRPYLKVTDNGRDRIHFAFTNGHPRNEPANSVYHVAYRAGGFFRADHTRVGAMEDLPLDIAACDRVFDGSGPAGRAWVWDIALDETGHPVIAYTRLPEETDHRYAWARWTGSGWFDTEITPAGPWFPQTPPGQAEREVHYSGGMALDSGNPSTVFLSRKGGGTFEIEEWRTANGGRTWTSRPLTRDSMHPQVRPVVPRGKRPGTTQVLWMSGNYIHYTDYATAIRMLEIPEA